MSKRRLVMFVLDQLGDILLIILAADLLYLCYANTWYDPFTWILGIEVIALWLIVIFGLFRWYVHIEEVFNDKRN